MKRGIDKQFNKELMTLAIPFALQGLLTSLVGASDALMLGRLTQDSIAAVSLANQVSFIMSKRFYSHCDSHAGQQLVLGT